MKQTVFSSLHHHFPDKITAITNGITPRRWLLTCNPGLAELVTDAIGDGWITDLDRLRELEPLATDPSFRARFADVKRRNKELLANLIQKRVGVEVDPDSLFDVQIKRIHEYKRQLLNILDAVATWLTIRERPDANWPKRVKILAGKAAPAMRGRSSSSSSPTMWPRHQRRPAHPRAPEARVPAELQCEPGRTGSSPPANCPNRSARPGWKRPGRAT